MRLICSDSRRSKKSKIEIVRSNLRLSKQLPLKELKPFENQRLPRPSWRQQGRMVLMLELMVKASIINIYLDRRAWSLSRTVKEVMEM